MDMSNMIVVIALAVIIIYTLIKRATLTNKVKTILELEHDIDNQLDRRTKTFIELISVMGKYMDTNVTTFGSVKTLSEKAQQAKKDGDNRSWVADEDRISREVEGVAFAFESHEDLKHDDDAVDLFNDLIEQETELALTKQQCNTHINTYYHAKNSLFGSMVAFTFGKSLNHDFETWHIDAAILEGRDKYEVK